MISSQQFLGIAPPWGTVSGFLPLLQSMDSSVPPTTATGPQNGNVGWQMFGWDDDTLDTYEISSQFFWNQAAGWMGWPTITETVAPTPVVSLPVSTPVSNPVATTPPVTQVVTSTPGASIVTAVPVSSTVLPVVAPITSQIATTTPGASISPATVTPTATGDVMVAGVDLSQIPWYLWLGAAGLAVWALSSKGGR